MVRLASALTASVLLASVACGQGGTPSAQYFTPQDAANNSNANQLYTRTQTVVGQPAAAPVMQPLPGSPLAIIEGGAGYWQTPRGWNQNLLAPRSGPRYEWQDLPGMLGNQESSAQSQFFTPPDAARNSNSTELFTRNQNVVGNQGTATGTIIGLQIGNQQETGSFGIVSGFLTGRGQSVGYAPALYGKRQLRASEDGTCGVGLGGVIPISDDNQGSILPWFYCTQRVRGNVWFQGDFGVSVPFSGQESVFILADGALLIPLNPRQMDPSAAKVFFMPELHAAYFAEPRSAGGNLANSPFIPQTGTQGQFILNATFGIGVRYRGFDIQAGVAVPFTSDRGFSHEVIARVGYRF